MLGRYFSTSVNLNLNFSCTHWAPLLGIVFICTLLASQPISQRAELASHRIPVRPNSEMGWKTRHLLWLVKALSPLLFHCSPALLLPFSSSLFSPALFVIAAPRLVSLVAARCRVPSIQTAHFILLFFFFMIIFFQTHLQPLRLFFFVPTGFCDPVLPHTHTHTPTIICVLCGFRRANLSREQGEGGKTILIRAAAVRVPSNWAPPHPPAKLLSFELINTKK